MKRKIIIPAMLLTGVLAFGTLGVTLASAQTAASYPPIVQKIADRFGLDAKEVIQVFQEAHDEHQAEMEAQMLERLDDAVAEGTITQEQRDALFDKHEEMLAKLERLGDLEPEERRAEAAKVHKEFKAWIEEQNIDSDHFTMFEEFKGNRHPKMKHFLEI